MSFRVTVTVITQSRMLDWKDVSCSDPSKLSVLIVSILL